MIILFGLGNNETKYLSTKHNIGRLVLENLTSQWGLFFVDNQGCQVAKYSKDLWLTYSNGYMNNSGEPLSKLLKYYKIQPNNCTIVIIQDDSDQNSGGIKLLAGGGTAGHNGIISCYQHLAGLGFEQKNIWRLKIGIRPVGNKLKSENFVLSANTKDDLDTVLITANQIKSSLNFLMENNWNRLQTKLNRKPQKPINEIEIDLN
jgi:peptidyl-tRNA hydrolase, PTH1 family